MNRRMSAQTIVLFSGFLLAQTPFLVVQAQPTPEATIDKFIRSNAPLPKSDAKTQQLYTEIRTWVGPYQGIHKDGKNYIATFQNASFPITVRLNDQGKIENLGVGCPRSESLSLSQAPSELRQPLSQCPNLKK